MNCFSRDIHEGYLSLQHADDEQKTFTNILRIIDKVAKSIEKKSFVSNIALFLLQEKKFLKTLKTNYFQ